MRAFDMLKWSWKISIAPAPIVEKNRSGESLTRFGSFESRKVFHGFTLPRTGDVIQIPDYGFCKIERIIHPTGRPSRNFLVTVVISPDSIGNHKWWANNINHPIVANPQNWSVDFQLNNSYYSDLLNKKIDGQT